MVVTKYVLSKDIEGKSKGKMKKLRIALVADLHNRPYADIISAIQNAESDMIAVAGDLMSGNYHHATQLSCQGNALEFLKEATAIAPTFYSLGNHEALVSGPIDLNAIEQTGTVLLHNGFCYWNGLIIGGLSSAACNASAWSLSRDMDNGNEPNLRWLDKFSHLQGFKILLCHHPEYYPKYIQETGTDIILSGHAHGGQWRFFGRGMFAPGQGWFPKLTSGVHDDRLVISRGLANTAGIPRICNPPELVIVDVISSQCFE